MILRLDLEGVSRLLQEPYLNSTILVKISTRMKLLYSNDLGIAVTAFRGLSS